MQHIHHRQPFPRAVPWAAGVLVAFCLIAATVARTTQVGTTAMTPSRAVEIRELRFADRPDGSIAVFRDGEQVLATTVPPGGDGFIRGVLRGLARERKRNDVAVDRPYRLSRRADGRLTVADPSTGRRVDVGAFGAANYGAFARLFIATAPHPTAAAEVTPEADAMPATLDDSSNTLRTIDATTIARKQS